MSCSACQGAVEPLIDFGPQPPSNRFLKAGQTAPTHPLKVGQCANCGLVQLIDQMPDAMKRPRYPWIYYIEPEQFLDDLAQRLWNMGCREILPATYKDHSLMARLEDLGCREAWNTDTVIGRHVLEHRRNITAYLNSWPFEVLVFEVPDSSRILEKQWFPFVWEEHAVYFTETTLRNAAAANGFTCEIIRYGMVYEDLLIAVMRRGKSEIQPVPKSDFGSKFAETKRQWQERTKGKKVALVGAGHLSVKFINLYELDVAFVTDDDANKQGLRLPGSGVEIVPTARLKEADLVLSSLAPESQVRFTQKHGIPTQSIFSALS